MYTQTLFSWRKVIMRTIAVLLTLFAILSCQQSSAQMNLHWLQGRSHQDHKNLSSNFMWRMEARARCWRASLSHPRHGRRFRCCYRPNGSSPVRRRHDHTGEPTPHCA